MNGVSARHDAVRGVDAESRAVVRGETTARAFFGPARDHDVATTEPDVGHSALLRARDSAVAEIERGSGARKPPTLELISEPTTRPMAAAGHTSDVFAPAGARARVLDAEAATPRDRPLKNLISQQPTDVDSGRRAQTTTTFHGPPRSIDNVRRPRVTDWFSRERESDKEKLLVKSVYDTEHAFHALKNGDERRAAHVVSLKEQLKQSGVFSSRDLALAIHAREKRALDDYSGVVLEERRDRVMAIGLLAREADDKYRDEMRALEQMVTKEFRQLDVDKQERVYRDLDSFTEDDRSNDSNFCRREMQRALKDEAVLHRAYIFALALEKRRRERPSAESGEFNKAERSGSRSRR